MYVSKNTEYNSRGNYTSLDDPNQQVFDKYYTNVTNLVVDVFYAYLVFNAILIIMYLLDINFKGNKGKFFKAAIWIQRAVSAIYYMFIWFLIYVRTKFEVQVCLCDYKNSYLKLRKYWHEAYDAGTSTRHKQILADDNY